MNILFYLYFALKSKGLIVNSKRLYQGGKMAVLGLGLFRSSMCFKQDMKGRNIRSTLYIERNVILDGWGHMA